MKKVFIVHGWDGYPEEGWFPWLKKELKARGFSVQIPAMPEVAEPKIKIWVSYLAKIVGDSDEDMFFIGHSIGCQTILRYLEELPVGESVGGVVFVAGWLTLKGLSTDEERVIMKPWLETPIDFGKVKKHARKFFAVFSNNDPFVPLSDRETFEEKLGAKTELERNKGHFSGSDGLKELPVVLEAILEMAGENK